MKFRIKGKGPIKREWLATMLAMIIEADNTWAPYKPNDFSDDLWTLDRGNDWKLQFDDVEDSRICEIRYRYKDSHFGPELFAYVEKRMGWERVVG